MPIIKSKLSAPAEVSRGAMSEALIPSNRLKSSSSAYVVDDSVKTRRGKTMPGISSHFDHLNGRCVMGQQILTLGLATEKQFIPLDSELYISRVKSQPLTKAFADGRSIAAKRYRDAQSMTKPEMVHGMIKRADRSGIHAQYFLADSAPAALPRV